MKNLQLVLIIGLFCGSLFAQTTEDERIAVQFFQLREYDKAEVLLKKQFDLNPSKFYDYLFKTYIQLKKFKEAVTITQSILKGNGKNIDYRYNLGLAQFKLNDTIEAYKTWHVTNDLASDNEYTAGMLVQKYNEQRQYKMVEDIILQTQKKTNRHDVMVLSLIDNYIKQDKLNEAIDRAFLLIDKAQDNYMALYDGFDFLETDAKALRLMEKKVFGKLATDPNSDKWNDLAMQTALAAKDYEQAMAMAKSHDKRKNGQGQQVFQIAEIAANEYQYDVAIDGYDYLIKNAPSHFSKMAYERKLKTFVSKMKRERLRDSATTQQINQEFLTYFSTYNFTNQTAETQLLFAEFTVKYLQRLDNAATILKKLLETPLIAKQYISRAKIDLADIKLALNDIWEASLLYGQVDKDEKDSPLGEEARFKNAKVFYFNGDYSLAEDLLSILKSSTTELIANDALQLATFIQDNIGDDAKELAMQDVSSAELFFYQNKPEEAFKLLASLKKVFPNSNLIDDVLLIEANYEKSIENYTRASGLYKDIYEKFPTSILADRAIYEWSIIEEEITKNNQAAMDGYLKLLTKYKDSVFSTDARKRLRKLRGEKLDDEV